MSCPLAWAETMYREQIRRMAYLRVFIQYCHQHKPSQVLMHMERLQKESERADQLDRYITASRVLYGPPAAPPS